MLVKSKILSGRNNSIEVFTARYIFIFRYQPSPFPRYLSTQEVPLSSFWRFILREKLRGTSPNGFLLHFVTWLD